MQEEISVENFAAFWSRVPGASPPGGLE